MNALLNTLAFLVFPYVMLTVFFLGHSYRYLTDRFDWNAKSSELLEKEGLRYGIFLFHWGYDLHVRRAFFRTTYPAMAAGSGGNHR